MVGVVLYAGILDKVVGAHLHGHPDLTLREIRRALPLARLVGADGLEESTLYALVLCIRTRNVKSKWLWILFILVGFGAVQANWTTGAKLPAGKPVVITFDNGYYSQYSAALPELKKLGWVADENMQLTGLPPSEGGLTDAQRQCIQMAYYDGLTPLLDSPDYVRQKGVRTLRGEVYDSDGQLAQRFENEYSITAEITR